MSERDSRRGKYGEPWHYSELAPWFLRDRDGLRLADTSMEREVPTEQAIANARRIRLAINACDGLTDEQLEAGVVAVAALKAKLLDMLLDKPLPGYETGGCEALKAVLRWLVDDRKEVNR